MCVITSRCISRAQRFNETFYCDSVIVFQLFCRPAMTDSHKVLLYWLYSFYGHRVKYLLVDAIAAGAAAVGVVVVVRQISRDTCSAPMGNFHAKFRRQPTHGTNFVHSAAATKHEY